VIWLSENKTLTEPGSILITGITSCACALNTVIIIKMLQGP